MLYQLSYASPTTMNHCREISGNPRTHASSALNTAQFLMLAHHKQPGKPPYPQSTAGTYGRTKRRKPLLHGGHIDPFAMRLASVSVVTACKAGTVGFLLA